MARTNPLADPEFAHLVAEAFVAGMSRQDMCEEFGVKDPDTITRWRRDPRVKQIALKLTRDRILRVTSKVDSKIEAMLERTDLTIRELVMIRQEFLGGVLRDQTNEVDDQTMNEAADLLEKDPGFMDELRELIERANTQGA